MDVYTTEEQQVEAIKKWWRENGKAVVLGAIVGLGGLYGWRYYQAEVTESKEKASEAYTQVITQLADAGDIEKAKAFVSGSDTSESYRVLAALQLAKQLVQQDDLNGAAEQLRLVKSMSKDSAIVAIAGTRLARVEAELGNYDTAITELDSITATGWKATVEDIRGDILVKQGNTDAARDAYSASLVEQDNPVVQMKLDNLSE